MTHSYMCTCMNDTKKKHLQDGNSSLLSPEWMYLTKTSNWAHEETSVELFTWKDNTGDAFIHHLVFHIFQHTWNAPLKFIAGKRYSSHFFLTSFSKKQFYCLQQTGFHKRFSNRVSFFTWQFQVRFHMKPVLLVKTSYKMSLTFQTWLHGVGRILNLFWREMPYHLRRSNRQSTKSFYNTAIFIFLYVDCKYTTINCR